MASDTQTSAWASLGGLHIGTGENGGTFWSAVIDDVRICDRAVKP